MCRKRRHRPAAVYLRFQGKDEEGRKIELELAQIARKSGVRLIGPNANGLYCPESLICTFPGALIAGGLPAESGKTGHPFPERLICGLHLSGSGGEKHPVQQSGRLWQRKRPQRRRFSGNYGQDKETTLIAGYLEGIKDGRRFYELARKISKQKPIIIWKGGLTEKRRTRCAGAYRLIGRLPASLGNHVQTGRDYQRQQH